jgi:LAO/AO transport system kinase
MITEFEQVAKTNDSFTVRRETQNVIWLKTLITMEIEQRILASDEVRHSYPELEVQVAAGQLTPFSAASEILNMVFKAGNQKGTG